MNDIVRLPGVEVQTIVDADERPTVDQLQIRIAALEAENRRLLALLNDGRYLARRALALLSSGGAPPIPPA